MVVVIGVPSSSGWTLPFVTPPARPVRSEDGGGPVAGGIGGAGDHHLGDLHGERTDLRERRAREGERVGKHAGQLVRVEAEPRIGGKALEEVVARRAPAGA